MAKKKSTRTRQKVGVGGIAGIGRLREEVRRRGVQPKLTESQIMRLLGKKKAEVVKKEREEQLAAARKRKKELTKARRKAQFEGFFGGVREAYEAPAGVLPAARAVAELWGIQKKKKRPVAKKKLK